jgi:hypothetical protein
MLCNVRFLASKETSLQILMLRTPEEPTGYNYAGAQITTAQLHDGTDHISRYKQTRLPNCQNTVTLTPICSVV